MYFFSVRVVISLSPNHVALPLSPFLFILRYSPPSLLSPFLYSPISSHTSSLLSSTLTVSHSGTAAFAGTLVLSYAVPRIRLAVLPSHRRPSHVVFTLLHVPAPFLYSPLLLSPFALFHETLIDTSSHSSLIKVPSSTLATPTYSIYNVFGSASSLAVLT